MAVKSYVVRGTHRRGWPVFAYDHSGAFGGPSETDIPLHVFPSLDTASGARAHMVRCGCSDVAIFRVLDDGREERLPSYEEALAMRPAVVLVCRDCGAEVERGQRCKAAGCVDPLAALEAAERAFRDPMAAVDQAADAQRAAHVGALLSAVAGLHVDEVRVLAAMARQLPGVRLRAACEASTAQGWVRSGATRVEVPSSPLARAQSSLLGTWREWIALVHGAQSTAARDVAQRDRGDVLADEAARRAGEGSR